MDTHSQLEPRHVLLAAVSWRASNGEYVHLPKVNKTEVNIVLVATFMLVVGLQQLYSAVWSW